MNIRSAMKAIVEDDESALKVNLADQERLRDEITALGPDP